MNSTVFKKMINNYPNITISFDDDSYNIDSYQISTLTSNLMLHMLALFDEIVRNINTSNINSNGTLYTSIFDTFDVFRRYCYYQYFLINYYS